MEAIRWTEDRLELLDQTRLPHEEIWNTYHTAAEVAAAIRDMKVRGAPAIGTSGAFGVAIEAHRFAGLAEIRERLQEAISTLRTARPTAVNLNWAMDRMEEVIAQTQDDAMLPAELYTKALQIAEDDVTINRAIGDVGASLFGDHVRILTHCNTGSLATTGYGTALGVIRSLHAQSKLAHVYADETRPYLQGARLTAFELLHEGIPFDIITDSMAGHLMQRRMVDAVVVGADRVARNGDTANKIGTYALAVLAKYHDIPFYVAAPVSTLDLATTSGVDIPIEERNSEEVTQIFGQRIAPVGATALHPAFDVTPGSLITGIITEHGVARHPYEDSLALHVKGEKSE
ncbi:S-methyl-5-thioribose-1-phosphate isomerase [Alicyclobacillus fastidiosus]|uniref:Methylthioribose-1-phosphate isomerase n=1 Tax=Alicyclobacillus fastidiosus TaxID=392011 RepID=A0ABV5AAT3_9BACL|nr:S-methyl-5-thioribose-1-phosphate isomerase [Alicyclobacillus fastidiosus]WEH11873.1 S-methyl-5-thioribose-1-phosphate isomerase [Alicyclobacillus fastidiosus]